MISTKEEENINTRLHYPSGQGNYISFGVRVILVVHEASGEVQSYHIYTKCSPCIRGSFKSSTHVFKKKKNDKDGWQRFHDY
jgi:hypothetical protein